MTSPDPNKARVLWTKGQNFFSAFFAELAELRKQIGDDAEFARWCLYDLHVPLVAINRVSEVLTVVDAAIVKANLASVRAAEAAEKRREREQREAYAAAERKRKEQQKAAEVAEKARQQELERQRLKAEATARRKKQEKKRNNKGYRQLENRKYNAALAQFAGTNVVPFEDQKAVKQVVEKTETQLAKLIKAAIVRAEKAMEDWVEAQVELAVLLCEARRRYPADQRFAQWLDENDIRLNTNDRAALLKLGQNPDAMRMILQRSHRRSVQLIWQDTKKQLPAV